MIEFVHDLYVLFTKKSTHVTDLLHQLLVSTFSSSTSRLSGQPMEVLLDESIEEEDALQEDKISARLGHALLVARQLFIEDSRVIGSSYHQWWTDLFSTSPFTGNGVSF